MKTPSIVRTVYLYLFSLIGLCLIVIGGVRLVDMGLRAFVFTKADEGNRLAQKAVYAPFSPVDIKELTEKEGLSEADKESIERWLADYEANREAEASRDYIGEQRARDAAQSLAFIFIGIPLYFYHWSVVRKESAKKEDQN
jgi:hypothetical protein